MYDSVTSDWYSTDKSTDCYSLTDSISSEQPFAASGLIQLWYYHSCIRPEAATGCNSSVAFLRVYMEACLKSTCIWTKFVLSAMWWHSWQSGNWQYVEFKININSQDHEKNGPCQSRFLVFLLFFLFYFFLGGGGGGVTHPTPLSFAPAAMECYMGQYWVD